MTIARGKKSDTLYITSSACGSIAVAENREDHNLWHQILGHMSERGLKIMHSKGKLPGIRAIDIDLCESCVMGKQNRVSFKKSGRDLRKDKLELVHTDVWGQPLSHSLAENTTS
ncbi:uncharacterized mitochondrial protein AtMg00300-like [Cornus florida]|uniref:uncharacterized mitochondrial protein AtMg00300-like n=1 Tax=Cornus florida TaxID=4283 RepID=UPI0028A12AA5|nr:uncharacterized mitochondrial protein AtMg00300-like [Cornus florida]